MGSLLMWAFLYCDARERSLSREQYIAPIRHMARTGSGRCRKVRSWAFFLRNQKAPSLHDSTISTIYSPHLSRNFPSPSFHLPQSSLGPWLSNSSTRHPPCIQPIPRTRPPGSSPTPSQNRRRPTFPFFRPHKTRSLTVRQALYSSSPPLLA